MKKLFALVLVFLILLAGCQQVDPTLSSNPDDSTAPSQTQASTPDTSPIISSGPIVTTRPTDPTETTAPTEQTTPEELTYFQELLTEYNTSSFYNFYNIATLSTFSSPQELNLLEILYNGIGRAGSHKLTEAELAHFTAIEPTLAFVDTNRMRPEEIDAILTLYFDITLEEINEEGKKYLTYWEETDCYYTFCTDMSWNSNITVTDCKKGEDGTVQVFYDTLYQEADSYVMTLKRVNGIYKILSNLPAK